MSFVYGQGDTDLRWDLQPLFQTVLFGMMCCFSIDAALVRLCQHLLTAGERGNRQGVGGGLTRPLPELGRHPSLAMRVPFGDYQTIYFGRLCRTALTLAEVPTSYLLMEKCCKGVTWTNCVTQKC